MVTVIDKVGELKAKYNTLRDMFEKEYPNVLPSFDQFVENGYPTLMCFDLPDGNVAEVNCIWKVGDDEFGDEEYFEERPVANAYIWPSDGSRIIKSFCA